MLIIIEHERPSNFDDEDVLQRISLDFVHDIEQDVDPNLLMNVYVLEDIGIEVLLKIRYFHIHQHLKDANHYDHSLLMLLLLFLLMLHVYPN